MYRISDIGNYFADRTLGNDSSMYLYDSYILVVSVVFVNGSHAFQESLESFRLSSLVLSSRVLRAQEIAPLSLSLSIREILIKL